ncbi:baseplate J/gp47 family protein [Mergibacter septicus]|uniref:baseplate J/gp47 family protein n=1 Tax=Mergibacter septicus TaxID=221402 RepID=UPI00223F3735|nr:baseplate J/gp47 family protein [Mergibacter septicus]
MLVSDVTLNDLGSARADFRSENLGSFNVESSAELKIETLTLGLNSVTTSENSILGVEIETDEQLRTRFFKSRGKNAQNSVFLEQNIKIEVQ